MTLERAVKSLTYFLQLAPFANEKTSNGIHCNYILKWPPSRELLLRGYGIYITVWKTLVWRHQQQDISTFLKIKVWIILYIFCLIRIELLRHFLVFVSLQLVLLSQGKRNLFCNQLSARQKLEFQLAITGNQSGKQVSEFACTKPISHLSAFKKN